jgi:hypothetical protein
MSAPKLIEKNPQYGPSPYHGSNHPETKEPKTSEHSEHDHRMKGA